MAWEEGRLRWSERGAAATAEEDVGDRDVAKTVADMLFCKSYLREFYLYFKFYDNHISTIFKLFTYITFKYF